MDCMRKMGGIAAWIAAGTYILGFVLLLTVLAPAGFGDLDQSAVQQAAVLVENQGTLYVFYIIVYVLNAVALAVLVLALYNRMKAKAPALSQSGAAFGLIWSGLVIASGMVANIGVSGVVHIYASNPELAGTTWASLNLVVEGLGGGNEIVGGLWVLVLSLAALASSAFPRVLSILGLLIAAAGLATVVPVLGDPGGAVFGIGMIVWFAWVGVVLLRRPSRAVA